jgi:hypothetical protein
MKTETKTLSELADHLSRHSYYRPCSVVPVYTGTVKWNNSLYEPLWFEKMFEPTFEDLTAAYMRLNSIIDAKVMELDTPHVIWMERSPIELVNVVLNGTNFYGLRCRGVAVVK